VTALLLRVAPWLALVGVAWFGGCQYAENRQADARIAALTERNAYLEDRVDIVDTVYDVDTVRFTRWRTKYDTLADSVRITDTVWVKEMIAVADSTVAACTDALRTCEVRVAYRDSIIAVADSILATERKRGTDWKTKLGWLLVGAAAGTLIPR
jgi:hypothetical protein